MIAPQVSVGTNMWTMTPTVTNGTAVWATAVS